MSVPEETITLTWYVKHQHTQDFTPAEFTEWVQNARLGIDDPTDLDEVYNRLDERDWKADEVLFDLASDRNWLESSEAEVVDLT